jgi:hypothetical protein
MLSTFRDGSGTEREPDGSTRPNWRQIERVFAELFTGGPPPENKGIFDVAAPSLDDPRLFYGLSIKSKQLPKRQFDRLAVDARTYMEIANSPAKLFDALDRHHCMNVEHIRAGKDPDVVGNCVLRTIKDWHEEGKVLFEREHRGAQLDLDHSVYICLSYRQWAEGEPRQYQIHSFSLQFPEDIEWEYAGRALRGYDPRHPGEVIFDWYAQSGGQLKYYPRASDALFSSPPFALENLDHVDLYERARRSWGPEWLAVQRQLHPSLVRRNLEEG